MRALVVMPLKNAGDEKATRNRGAGRQARRPSRRGGDGMGRVLLLPVTDYRAFLDQFPSGQDGREGDRGEVRWQDGLGGRPRRLCPAGRAPRPQALEAVLEAKQSIEAEWRGCGPGWRKTTGPSWPPARTVKLLAARRSRRPAR